MTLLDNVCSVFLVQFSGGRESRGEWLLSNLAGEGSSMSNGNWGLEEPVSAWRSGQLWVLSPPAQTVESERPALGFWSQYLGLCTWEQLFNLSQCQFPFLSHGDVHASFRSWSFVRQCRSLYSHLDLSPLFAVGHCHMETIRRPLFFKSCPGQ